MSHKTYKDCLLTDADNTLADNNHRLHLITNKPKDWNRYDELADLDTPITPVIDAVNGFYKSGYYVIVLTGRSDRNKEQTNRWLHKHGVLFHKLVMRDSKDHRKDTFMKRDALYDLRKQGYSPSIAFEDRPHLVNMFREEGLFVFDIDQVQIPIIELEHDKKDGFNIVERKQ